jgi:hypothetical protein
MYVTFTDSLADNRSKFIREKRSKFYRMYTYQGRKADKILHNLLKCDHSSRDMTNLCHKSQDDPLMLSWNI